MCSELSTTRLLVLFPTAGPPFHPPTPIAELGSSLASFLLPGPLLQVNEEEGFCLICIGWEVLMRPPMPPMVDGCGVPGPQRWQAGAGNLSVTSTSVKIMSPESVRRGPWIKFWGHRKAWEGTKTRRENQKFGHRCQESFKGGSGYHCQMLLVKRSHDRRPEKCLGNMSPCGCWWHQQGQLPRCVGADFLPITLHSESVLQVGSFPNSPKAGTGTSPLHSHDKQWRHTSDLQCTHVSVCTDWSV